MKKDLFMKIMERITLTIDSQSYAGLKEYLQNLEGVFKVSIISNEFLTVDITYDETKVSLNMLKLEILLYLNLSKIPSIIGFNKYKEGNTKKYTTSIKNFCCECCLKYFIEKLLDNPDITIVTTNYSDDALITKKLKLQLTYNADKEIEEIKEGIKNL